MRTKFLFFVSLIMLLSCENEEIVGNHISLLSISANGSAFSKGMENVPAELELSLVFDAILKPESFKSALSISNATGEVPLKVTFSNVNSKAVIMTQLDYSSEYTLKIKSNIIGLKSRRLAKPITVSFSTGEDTVIRSMPPCLSDCRETIDLTVGTKETKFSFYSNYPIYTQNAEWENLTSALIVVHGNGQNPQDYYSYLSTTLASTELVENTILIAPWFKDKSKAGNNEFYWNSSDWREGQDSDNEAKLSSFAIIDSLVQQLANKERFPVLENIIITGHSSGGLFTHVYAGANRLESLYPNIDFKYIVANSQYFYYPNDYRYDEETGEFLIPTDCNTFWPLTFKDPPTYLNEFSEEEFNEQFINRDIIYLLGNGTATDRTLNTSDCSAVLLGSSRYQRGENMFLFMDEFYPGHSHSKKIVEGIGHNGKGMYQSPEFKSLIKQLLKK